jgi:hypothetical protein
VILRILTVFLLTLALNAEPARSDVQIEAQIKTKLAKSVIGKDGFAVRVKDGVAYWTGSTTIPQHKGGATRMAKAAGAKRVVNDIHVIGAKGPGKSVAKAAPEIAPAPVAVTVKPSKTAEAPKPQIIPAVPGVANPAAAASPKRATVQWVPAR